MSANRITPPSPFARRNSPERLAVIGDPISHSLSPVLQNFLIRHFALPFVYEALHVCTADLSNLVARLRNGELAGVNVTIPHKQAIMPLLEELAYPADGIGAVNTVTVSSGKLTGHNTDVIGFRRSLEKAKIASCNKEVLILGAGGAAKAVVFVLLEAGAAAIHLCNRDAERARRLRAALPDPERVRILDWDDREKVLQARNIDVIVNATSVGMSVTKADSPLRAPKLHGNMAVIDLIYNPAETFLLWQAQQAGATTLNGLPMLIHQGAAALELWSGKRLDTEGVYATLERRLRQTLEVRNHTDATIFATMPFNQSSS